MKISFFGMMVLLFIILTAYLIGAGEIRFGEENYWNHHGLFFLIMITIFPRLTLLFSSVPFGGLCWWLGFFFLPRYLVAVLATFAYGMVNPFLVVIAWILAIGGESSEKYIVTRRFSRFG